MAVIVDIGTLILPSTSPIPAAPAHLRPPGMRKSAQRRPTHRSSQMKEKPPPKTRSYGIDSRHFFPMFRDFVELATVRLANSKTRRHVVQLGRSIRQHAFDARDTLPIIDHPALAAFLGCNEPRE